MILLIRHCTPKVNYSKCNYKEAVRRLEEYHSTCDIALEEIKPFRPYLDKLLEKKLVVLSSSSPRALITAKEIFSKKFNIVGDNNFIEFDSKVLAIPFIKFKFKTWLTISRWLWLMGLLRTNRSFTQEKLRAKECASLLHEKSQKTSVILVAHASLNFYIEKYLKIKGYSRISTENNGCFTITRLHYFNLSK